MSAPAREWRAALERELSTLIVRYGGHADSALVRAIESALDQLLEALAHSAGDGEGQRLAPDTIVRIRLGKFAASRLPPQIYRDPERLAALRADLAELARRYFAGT